MQVHNMGIEFHESQGALPQVAICEIWQNTLANLQPATLYLIAVPIGNLADISLRALAVLQNVDYIACEDTRTTALLLSHYKLSRPLFSLHAHNEKERINYLLELLQAQKKVALVSDAGYPLLSDPGALVTRAVAEQGYRIEVIPGANAALVGLLASAIDPTKFSFLGFLPRKGKERQAYLWQIATSKITTIVYESPLRVKTLLSELLQLGLADRQICLARELTKRYETYMRMPLRELLQAVTEKEPKGECVLIFSACSDSERAEFQQLQILASSEPANIYTYEKFQVLCQQKQIDWANCLVQIQKQYPEVETVIFEQLAFNYLNNMKSKDNVKELSKLFPTYNKHVLYDLLLDCQAILEG